jgi:DNA-binding NarL/FixJ family response regulator
MNTPTHRVFLVDDHPLFRQGLAGLIDRRPGFHVCGHAESADEALEMIKSLKPDVALVDLTLKSGHGLELIAQLKQELPQMASVVLSMHDERHFAERSIRAGALGYVMKSESPDVVLQALDHAVRGESFLSEQMRALAVERFVKGLPSAPSSPEEVLSARELEIFQLLGKGKETRQIAEELGLSIKTVQTFCAKIKDKLHIKNSTALLREAVKWADSLALS